MSSPYLAIDRPTVCEYHLYALRNLHHVRNTLLCFGICYTATSSNDKFLMDPCTVDDNLLDELFYVNFGKTFLLPELIVT